MAYPKYIVWSYDHEEHQTFTDIYRAKSPAHAERRVQRERPYAILDSVVPPMLLSEYVKGLQEELITK